MNISLIQTSLFWEDIDKNLVFLGQKMQNLEGSDLIILPETFSSGFTMQAEKFASYAGEKTLAWMIEMSSLTGSAITGSTICEEDGKFYNRLYFVKPDGSYEKYDKRHLFTPGKEREHYTAGKERLIVDYKGWKICPLICYDLRFPVFSRNDCRYDLLIYVANWPEKRDYAWTTLLKARAIENQSYVLACNRVGQDANGVNHIGNSGIINYLGEEMSFGDVENVFSFVLNKEIQDKFRQELNFLDDSDKFQIL